MEFIRKSFVSNEITERLLEEIMEIRGSTSRSHIIRDAIFEYRRDTKAPYLEKSFVLKEKEDKMAEEKRLEDMTPTRFILDVLKGFVLVNTDGKEVAIYHGAANNLWFEDPQTAKKRCIMYPEIITYHQERTKTHGSALEKMKGNSYQVERRDQKIDLDNLQMVE